VRFATSSEFFSRSPMAAAAEARLEGQANRSKSGSHNCSLKL